MCNKTVRVETDTHISMCRVHQGKQWFCFMPKVSGYGKPKIWYQPVNKKTGQGWQAQRGHETFDSNNKALWAFTKKVSQSLPPKK